jgi:hypothetical protein
LCWSLEAAGAADISACSIRFVSDGAVVVWALVLSWSPQPAPALALASRRPRVGASVGAAASLCASDSWEPVVAVAIAQGRDDKVDFIGIRQRNCACSSKISKKQLQLLSRSHTGSPV